MSHVYNSFPYCSKCGRHMGSMSTDEWQAMVDAEGLEPKCFDCSPDEANTFPDFFSYVRPREIVILGDAVFEVSSELFLVLLDGVVPSHAHAPTPAVCLSSSTYLNTNPNKGGERKKSVMSDAICPSCKIGRLITDNGGDICEKCDYYRLPIESIIIPSWIVTQPERAKPCPDCNDVRRASMFSGPGSEKWYCAYHHALLIEQQEDASLGWGHE